MCEALRRLMKDEIAAELSAAVSDTETKTKVEFAEKMISDGVPTSAIIKYTDLTLEKLQELSDKLGVALVM